jgi:hypothetical protein
VATLSGEDVVSDLRPGSLSKLKSEGPRWQLQLDGVVDFKMRCQIILKDFRHLEATHRYQV